MTQWADIIGPFKKTPEFIHAYNYQKERRAQGFNVLPPQKDIFNAFVYTPFDKLKVAILGQDPYPTPGVAMGLSFSVHTGTRVPQSLNNIYKELCNDIPGYKVPDHGNLIPWARQGVLLLNSVLTVEAGESNCHKGQGWEKFTDDVIKAINDMCNNIVFILWGRDAQVKGAQIDPNKHLILKSAHPSPMSASRGFFGNHQFSTTNQYLLEHGKKPIDWQLPLHLEGDEEL